MTQIEIWLRLAQVNELYGDEMVRIAHWLNTQPSISNAVLLQAGFSPRRKALFNLFGSDAGKTLRWLEQPNHHFVVADSEHYPPQLRAIEDYLGCFCRRKSRMSSLVRWPLSAADSTRYGERWGDCFVKSLQHVV